MSHDKNIGLGPVPDLAKRKDTTEPRLLDANLIEDLLSASIEDDNGCELRPPHGTKRCPKCGYGSLEGGSR